MSGITPRATRFNAALLYLAALAPRVALIIFGHSADLTTFSRFYSERHGALWPPFPTLFFRLTRCLSGNEPFICLLAYAAVSALVAPLVWAVAKELRLGKAAWPAALSAAFYPYYVSMVLYQPDAGISVVLMAFSVWGFARFAVRLSAANAGMVAFLAVLFISDRSNAVTYVCFAIAWAVCAAIRSNKISVARYLVIWIALLLTLFSGVRYAAYGRFTPLAQNGGYTLLLGHNPYIGKYLHRHHDSSPVDYVRTAAVAAGEDWKGSHDPANESRLVHKAFKYASTHRRASIVNFFLKIYRYWDVRLEDSDREPFWKNAAYFVPYALLLLFAVPGTRVLLQTRQRGTTLFLWGALWSYGLAGFLTIPEIRMRMHSEFLLMLLAAQGFTNVRNLVFGAKADII